MYFLWKNLEMTETDQTFVQSTFLCIRCSKNTRIVRNLTVTTVSMTICSTELLGNVLRFFCNCAAVILLYVAGKWFQVSQFWW